jgi:phytanoyl-CoA hydroxylase
VAVSKVDVEQYAQDGYVLLRDAISDDALNLLERQLLDFVHSLSNKSFLTLADPNFAQYLSENRDLERSLYDGVRDYPWLQNFSAHKSIVKLVAKILGDDFGLLQKIPLRFDLPMVMRELAVWHQDYYYVRGNTETVTAWIPLQDTPYENGCLMVMPGSHHLGVIEHDKPLLKKKKIPSDIFHQEVRYVEMKRGDVLLFNALLLHSSGINISDRLRMSVQARYSKMRETTDPAMGQLIKMEL